MSKKHSIKENDFLVMWKQARGEWIPNFVEGKIYSTKTDEYLKPYVDSKGYYTFMARTMTGVRRQIYVHRALWVMRYGIPYDPALQVDHINMNTLDNRLCNLRLVTCGENKRNSRGFAVAEEIRSEKAAGARTGELAKKYCYSPAMISCIVSGYRYDPAKHPGTEKKPQVHYSNPAGGDEFLRWMP